MKATIEAYGYKYTVECEDDDLDIWHVVERLIRPLLSGLGYMEGSIDEVIGESNDRGYE